MSHPFAAISRINAAIERAADDVRGVMATVSESAGHLVRVQTSREGTVRGQWYPALTVDLPADAVGVLMPLAAGNAVFLPLGLPIGPPTIAPTAIRDGGSVGTYADSGTGVPLASLQTTLTLDPAGTYLIAAWSRLRILPDASAPMVHIAVRIGTDGGADALGPQGAGHGATEYEWASADHSRTVSGVGSVQINTMAYSANTATQSVAGGDLRVWYWRTA